MRMAEWQPIPGYHYSVSSDGEIKNNLTQKKMRPHYAGRAREYQTVYLRNENGPKRFYVHRLVAQAFVENPGCKEQVNHIDGDKSNNVASNLEWATQSENQLHRFHVLGKGMPPGYMKKLQDVAKKYTSIKVRCVETGEVFQSQSDAAKSLGLHICTINACVSGRNKTAGGFHWERIDASD
jgi:hypothetical protein